MLYYPKIPGSRDAPVGSCVAFEKYDGTNLHWDWDRDFGWHSFGTRRDEFDLSEAGIARFMAAHTHLRRVRRCFHATLAEGLEGIFTEHEAYREFVGFRVFTEFLGPNSFAGLHKADDPKRLVLFDISARAVRDDRPGAVRRRLRTPADRQGRLPGQADRQVRRGRPHGQVRRHGGRRVQGGLRRADLWMAKIKTYAYLEKLKRAFGERWEDYWE